MHDFDETDYRQFWPLDSDTFLNHGSFGACPIPVLRKQEALRAQLESQPVRFFLREYEPLLEQARGALASFIAADPADIVFVANATTGINTVLRSIPLEPGDELLTTDHEYNACRNALEFVAQRAGARVNVARVPFPLDNSRSVSTAVLDAVTHKTRLALLDHVTSPTALVFPLADLVDQLRSRGVATLVDGAHAPGMIPLSIQKLRPDYYAGNCHKWMCCPKGTGFLYVSREHQRRVRPLIISHGANAPEQEKTRYHLEFDWTGTHDPTGFLCIPEAIRFLGTLLPGGWHELREHNHQLALHARDILCSALGVEPPCPDAMLGSMASVPLPPGSAASPPAWPRLDPLQHRLYDQYGIEVPIVSWPSHPQRLIRISAQIYNKITEYERLGAALAAERGLSSPNAQ